MKRTDEQIKAKDSKGNNYYFTNKRRWAKLTNLKT